MGTLTESMVGVARYDRDSGRLVSALASDGFKILLGFAAVFAEEIGGFEVAFALGGQI